MKINKSPWIHQLDTNREIVSLKNDIDTDITIIGAGIAGISTAFYILKNTNNRVVLVDQGKIAHGATGHNAGQVVARFERPLDEIEKEFGFEKTKDAIQSIHHAWILLEEMYTEANLDIIFSRTRGFIGMSTLSQVIDVMKDMDIMIRSGLPKNELLISREAGFIKQLPKVYENFYKIVDQSQIMEKMETDDKEFCALYEDQAGCINSALFCQEIVKYLTTKYEGRLSIYENTGIKKIVLKNNHAILDAVKNTINTSRVILCTNGFEKFDILNEDGLSIDKKFHHLVNGAVGYMSGYLEEMNKTPTVIAYLKSNYISSNLNDPYYYLTRRPHEYGDKKHNLICMGGPEIYIHDRAEYMKDYEYPESIPKQIDDFIKKEYDFGSKNKINYDFTWHGLMGYTPNRIRLIGEDKKNKVLLYNLGCNGIGILPSIYGGKRISQILSGENVRPSIFDPK
jgi:glycine/D-amino acid oxidase-like deaminating enzyme